MKLNLFIFLFILHINAKTWVDNSPKNTIVSYLYAPGTFSCECRMSIYMPKFVSSTCEEITCSEGIEVLKYPASACNFSEVLLKRFSFIPHKPVKSIKKLFKKCVYKISGYCNEGHRIKIQPFCEGKSTSLSSQLTDISKINFGQDLDIAIFKQNYQKHLLGLNDNYQDYNKQIVLYGFSRGAATVFSFMSLHKPKEVCALICEGMFDSIPNILKHRFPNTYKVMLNFLEKFTHFKTEAISPISAIKDISLDLPILLITSYADYIVSHECVLNLYKSLRELGHAKVHILILQKPGHLKYVFHNQDDKDMYEQTVHAFYKKYNLPYIEDLAIKGEQYFAHTQP
ncbi:MAG: prolyl oligopeptidase family serine peptidase [Candidatus Babeliales bacterium]|nr:prolyl oligopeptidase family serine peptidase [Candidatus Babeliales bacterium]